MRSHVATHRAQPNVDSVRRGIRPSERERFTSRDERFCEHHLVVGSDKCMPQESCCQDRKRQNHFENITVLIRLGGIQCVDGLSSSALDMRSE